MPGPSVPVSALRDPTLLREAAYVNGQWVKAGGAGARELRNPATGARIADIPKLDAGQVVAAIEAAHRAQPAWRARSGKERALVLRRWFELVLDNAEDLARLIVIEEGKPFAEAKGEVAYAASFIEWFAEEAKRVRGDVIAAPQGSRRILTLKEPIGVCAAITPWNFPAAMVTRKVGPALAAGCTMVLKPAEQTPLTALALADLAARAGVPAGVFSVVTGDARTIGGELTRNPLVRKLSFTGSTEVGRILIAQSAATVKRVSMELGGNAPFLIFDDADIDAAVAGLMAAKYRNTGQACISANRILVQDGIYDRFAAALASKVANLRVGEGFDEGVEQGPLIDEAALAKVEAFVEDALTGGAALAQGGARHSLGGLFFAPTILTGVTPDMMVYREEIFGPIASLVRFKDEAEAIALANGTDLGLAAYIYARDADRIWRVAAAIEAGMIGINTGALSNEVTPFGGVKQSGLGREGSIYGIDEYLEIKSLAWDISAAA